LYDLLRHSLVDLLTGEEIEILKRLTQQAVCSGVLFLILINQGLL
jgi:hypothetical protein